MRREKKLVLIGIAVFMVLMVLNTLLMARLMVLPKQPQQSESQASQESSSRPHIITECKHLIWVRHSEALVNDPKICDLIDPPLTSEGIKHASEQGGRSANVVAVFSSPLSRALETARIVAPQDLVVRAVPALRDPYDVTCITGRSRSELMNAYPGTRIDWQLLGENWFEVPLSPLEQTIGLAESLRHVSYTDGAVMLVTHNPTLKNMIGQELGHAEFLEGFWKFGSDHRMLPCSQSEVVIA